MLSPGGADRGERDEHVTGHGLFSQAARQRTKSWRGAFIFSVSSGSECSGRARRSGDIQRRLRKGRNSPGRVVRTGENHSRGSALFSVDAASAVEAASRKED